MEHLFVSCKTTADIRAAGKRFPHLASGLDDALQPLCDLLYDRFEQLDLKGTAFKRGEKASSADADAFFHLIKVGALHQCHISELAS